MVDGRVSLYFTVIFEANGQRFKGKPFAFAIGQIFANLNFSSIRELKG